MSAKFLEWFQRIFIQFIQFAATKVQVLQFGKVFGDQTDLKIQKFALIYLFIFRTSEVSMSSLEKLHSTKLFPQRRPIGSIPCLCFFNRFRIQDTKFRFQLITRDEIVWQKKINFADCWDFCSLKIIFRISIQIEFLNY